MAQPTISEVLSNYGSVVGYRRNPPDVRRAIGGCGPLRIHELGESVCGGLSPPYETAAELIMQEKISVNGTEVSRLKVAGGGTVFYGYSRLGKAGYVQLMAITEADKFEGLKTELDELLNGLVINSP